MLVSGLGNANAEEALARRIHWSIGASTLPSALLQFSVQSGLQVAADDRRVAMLTSNGVAGDLSVRAALRRLLEGTDLSYELVGEHMVAIRPSPAGPSIDVLRHRNGTQGAGASAAVPPASQIQPEPTLPDVHVVSLLPPTPQALTDAALYQFVAHHSTVHYVNTGTRGNLARWRGGRSQTLCPTTRGLDAASGAFVTERMRALASRVGAPLDSEPGCKDNVRFIFTDEPAAAMDDVVNWAAKSFRTSLSIVKRRLAVDGSHAVQGWYFTASGGDRVLNTDLGFLQLHLVPVWPRMTPQAQNDWGDMSGIAMVIFIVDTTQISQTAIGTIADYLAVLALSVAQTPDHCDPLPSVLDVMAPSCQMRESPDGVTPGDLAFLRGLYYRNSGLGASPSRVDIQAHMLRELTGGRNDGALTGAR